MNSSWTFRRMFAGADLEIEDLFLLEAFQIDYLPGWIPDAELRVVLREYPEIGRYLRKRNPGIAGFLDRVGDGGAIVEKDLDLRQCCDAVVWTVADLLVYNKCPEIYDQLPFHLWDFAEVTAITDLAGKAVLDGGAGTGRVALEAARAAKTVYAVEPVARLRRFIKEKSALAGLSNLYVVDGFLHDLPFPDSSYEVLITSHALGWHLEKELVEFERVVKPGGWVIHCPGTAETERDEVHHQVLISPPWAYSWARTSSISKARGIYPPSSVLAIRWFASSMPASRYPRSPSFFARPSRTRKALAYSTQTERAIWSREKNGTL